MNRQQAIELARKIHDIRAKRIQNDDGQLSYHTLLRLKEMELPKRYNMMERLVREGYAPDVKTIERLLNSKAVSGSTGGNAYCPGHTMSDKITDPGTHY